jgi:hypothetical protein
MIIFFILIKKECKKMGLFVLCMLGYNNIIKHNNLNKGIILSSFKGGTTQ